MSFIIELRNPKNNLIISFSHQEEKLNDYENKMDCLQMHKMKFKLPNKYLPT